MSIYSNILIALTFFFSFIHAQAQVQYTMPYEGSAHEGTWLAWPHDSTYYSGYREFFEPAWIEMTRQLIKGERVHIIAYSADEQNHITAVLASNGIALDSIGFLIMPTDDYWMRDNGPIYVKDSNQQLHITDWDFDGWGNDAAYALDNQVPATIAASTGVPSIDLSDMVLEGGALIGDGNGTMIATRSSIQGDGRNESLTEEEINHYLTTYLGFTNIIWLDGKFGGNFDITDMHIDGFATFADSNTIVTMNNNDLLYWFVPQADINTLYNATNASGQIYDKVYLPLTKKNVKTTDGKNTYSKGSYVNYYEANAVVLVPIYNDENDAAAISILAGLYPGKEVVGIDCRNMFSWGGMVHCVVQQQPAAPCLPPAVSAAAQGSTNFCKGENVILLATAGNEVSYQWKKNGTAINGATLASYTVTESGDYLVTVSNNCGSASSEVISCTKNSKPSATVMPSGTVNMCAGQTTVLTANAGNNLTYQWKKDNNNIAGATAVTYAATEAGKYKVSVTNTQTGCSKNSSATTIAITCRAGDAADIQTLNIFPNPSASSFSMNLNDREDVRVYNLLGQVMLEIHGAAGTIHFGHQLPAGVYWVTAGLLQARIVKE
jgi:agmatine deiminase